MKGWSIKWRVLLLALIPPIVISLLLALYFTKVRVGDVQQSLRDRGHALARQLAPASEYGLFTRNREVLQELADAVKRESDVSLVTISDGAGQFLATSGDLEQRQILTEKPKGISLGLLEYPELLYFSEPVRQSRMRADDIAEQSFDPPAARDGNRAVLGWVNITMSKGSTVQRQQEILRNSAMMLLAGMLLTAILGIALKCRHHPADPAAGYRSRSNHPRQFDCASSRQRRRRTIGIGAGH